MLIFKITPHLRRLCQRYPALKRQFYPSPAELADGGADDPLLEKKYLVVKGLIHKYKNRALVLLTLNCAAYCRFCTRRRVVSDIMGGILSDQDLKQIERYLRLHQEIKELIFSGGDPLTVPALLNKALLRFARLPQIKVIRIGTRLPVSDPIKVDQQVLAALRVVKRQPLYLLINFEHPAEITRLTISALKRLQSVATMLLSQTVMLKGVNDSVDILDELFSRLVELGVKPYYLLRCDQVKGASHFLVDLAKEKVIFTTLRKRLSGLACPSHVQDSPLTMGKQLLL